MSLQDTVTAVLESLKPQVEVLVKAAIEAKSDDLVDLVLAKIAELIPGKLDDALLASLATTIKATVKEAALKAADQISDKV